MLLESLTKLATRLLAVSLLCFLWQAPASAADCAKDTLCRILTEGKLKAGVVVDYTPWGFRGATGEFMGMEPDMARDVAKTLGVAIEFVPVNSANRMQFLQQGQIDLMPSRSSAARSSASCTRTTIPRAITLSFRNRSRPRTGLR